MAINPEIDGLATAEAAPEAHVEATNGHQWPAEAPQVDSGAAPNAVLEPAAPAQPEAAPIVPVVKARRPRPVWLVPATITLVGLIVSGMLGYFLYATIQQRDGARHQLATTQATLASTQQRLTAAQTDAAARKKVASYVALYISDNARVQTDYQTEVVCDNYSTCRTAAQQLLIDMQGFQNDRAATGVPDALASSDSAAGDSLSAGIAGVQEFIVGMDDGNLSKIKDGGSKIDAAMLNLDKAEETLGSSLS